MNDQKLTSQTEEEWKKVLTPEQYKILREKGTEPAFTGKYVHEKGEGMYKCSACGNPLFPSNAKFDSGTGWPSFDEALPGSIKYKQDSSYGMERTEVVCAKCGSHLGHLFKDGPTKTGKRYCINSVCLELEKNKNSALNMSKEEPKIESEPKENPSKEYGDLLGSYIRLTKQVRNLQNRFRGINDHETNFKIQTKDSDRHEIHLKLLEIAQKLGKTKDDVLVDIIRQDNTLEEYGLPEFSILTAEDLIDMEDWHDPDYFHVDTKKRRPLLEPIPDWVEEEIREKKRKSLISPEDIMLVFSISPIGDYGATIMYPADYQEIVRRAMALAKEINGNVFKQSDSGYHDASAEILGVILSKKDLEKVAGIIRNNPDKFRLGEQFYEKAGKLLLKKINDTLKNFGSERRIDDPPGFVEYSEVLIGKKVVMVDDDPEVFEAYAPDLIVSTGDHAEFIGYYGQNFDELVQQILSLEADIVLLDYHLSDTLKGTEIAKALKNRGFNGLIFGFTSDRRASQKFTEAGAKKTIDKNVKSPEDAIQTIAFNTD